MGRARALAWTTCQPDPLRQERQRFSVEQGNMSAQVTELEAHVSGNRWLVRVGRHVPGDPPANVVVAYSSHRSEAAAKSNALRLMRIYGG